MSGTCAEAAPRPAGWARALEAFVGSWRFAMLALAVLGTWTALQVLLLTVPAPEGFGADWMRQLRVLCLGMNPDTGGYEAVWLTMLIGDPLALAAVVAAVWWRPLTDAHRSLGARRMARWAWPGAGAVLAGVGALSFFAEPEPAPATDAQGRLIFPATDLRLASPAPDLTGLVDHRGVPVRAEDWRGRPVLLTAVYGCCSRTCPILLSEAVLAHRAQADAGRDDWMLIAVTMDPERDDPAALRALAEAYQIANDPSWRLLTGDPAAVNRALDAMGVVRERNPATGEIEHSNQFLLLDRAGRLAYRLGLASEAAPDWLAQAMSLLQTEVGAP